MRHRQIHLSGALALVLAALATQSVSAASICDRFISRVVVKQIEGIKCAFAYARCREGEMDADGKFTGKLLSNQVGRGKLACKADFARDAKACLADESPEAQFCWSRLSEAFHPGGLE